MTKLTHSKLNDYLVQHPTPSLTASVVEDLKSSDQPHERLHDLLTCGCVSGLIGDLTYNQDCLDLYHRFESRIWELVFAFLDGLLSLPAL